MTEQFKTFEQGIDFTFNNGELLRQAFTHRSYLNEHRDEGLEHNERLEFLGDAVLELVVTHYLYEKFPTHPEGDLTAYRAALVNAVTLSEVASEIGMNDYLLLSRGEAKDTGRARAILLANAIEALIGAIYLDQGYDAAKRFVEKFLFPKVEEIMRKKLWRDPKSTLQEKAQDIEGATPYYTVVRETGPDHDKQFIVGVYVKDYLLAQGSGKSKQEAEQDAARNALEENGW
ncbi:MAG: ribonuclease III [Patescibacteria group bacterium]|nr:ribonuclease III [Patescibacteria group bacterium]